MRRRALAPLSAAFALAVSFASTAGPSAQAPSISADTSQVNAAVRERVDAAARLSIAHYSEWLGPPPFDRVSVGDGNGVSLRVPAWDSAATMAIESQVAEGIALGWLARVEGHDAWKRGVASYLQSRIVEKLFNLAFLINAHSYDSSCFFGCRVRWAYRSLPISRWQALQDPLAVAVASLERELGWPTLQGALRAAAAGGRDPIAAISAAAGRDLAPVFAAAATPIDHAVVNVTSGRGRCEAPCSRTDVSIASNGPIPFPLVLRVSFADGKSIDTMWRGRDRISFESAAPAVAARLDPDRVLLLDRDPLNNVRINSQPTNVPIAKWVSRWILWLQDAMLAQTFPV